MRLPALIYELLPYLYLGIGSAGILMTGEPLGWFCGGLLLVVGLGIRRTRRVCREPIIGSRLN